MVESSRRLYAYIPSSAPEDAHTHPHVILAVILSDIIGHVYHTMMPQAGQRQSSAKVKSKGRRHNNTKSGSGRPEHDEDDLDMEGDVSQ